MQAWGSKQVQVLLVQELCTYVCIRKVDMQSYKICRQGKLNNTIQFVLRIRRLCMQLVRNLLLTKVSDMYS
jgi:hypothetical protein